MNKSRKEVFRKWKIKSKFVTGYDEDVVKDDKGFECKIVPYTKYKKSRHIIAVFAPVSQR